MNFEEKLRQKQYAALWEEYCGFLDLSVKEYMEIQKRLMEEQIQLWSASPLGLRLLKGKRPRTIEEFREALPLTTYEDYAPDLLARRGDLLPMEPVLWIETTWEGGRHPVKVAPYTQTMLDVYRNNVMAIFMLATSSGRGDFNIRPGDRMLYGLAPLPYATGLLPLLLDAEISLEFLPPVKSAEKMSFRERNKAGFQLGARKGIQLFFGLSSVAAYIGESFGSASSGGGGLKDLFRTHPRMIWRYLAARYRSCKEGRSILPKDLFPLKGFVCAGTDSGAYKKRLEELWGRKPLEISAGTEPTCIATETWEKQGMVFFPDACFYEFIPEEELLRNREDPSYQPRTYLMDEVIPGKIYEIVITVLKGGAFARYRVGDLYRCLPSGVGTEGLSLPKFQFLDRVPGVIDIAGFTRITENSIQEVISLSGLKIGEWIAAKEFNEDNKPFLHLVVEMEEGASQTMALSRQILEAHLSIYFSYKDSDYSDLKKLLGIDPLVITILQQGTFRLFRQETGISLPRVTPPPHDFMELLRFRDHYRESGRVVRPS